MILVDNSVWVEHFRRGLPTLARLLERCEVLGHPFVVGEIALGSLRDRKTVLRDLESLPPASVATVAEVAALIETESLHARGIGYVDAALLAATRLTPEARLWTRDAGLAAAARELAVGFDSEAVPD